MALKQAYAAQRRETLRPVGVFFAFFSVQYRQKGGIALDQVRVGKFIAETRKAQGLTQRQLADALSISDKTVSKWETGGSLR